VGCGPNFFHLCRPTLFYLNTTLPDTARSPQFCVTSVVTPPGVPAKTEYRSTGAGRARLSLTPSSTAILCRWCFFRVRLPVNRGKLSYIVVPCEFRCRLQQVSVTVRNADHPLYTRGRVPFTAVPGRPATDVGLRPGKTTARELRASVARYRSGRDRNAG